MRTLTLRALHRRHPFRDFLCPKRRFGFVIVAETSGQLRLIVHIRVGDSGFLLMLGFVCWHSRKWIIIQIRSSQGSRRETIHGGEGAITPHQTASGQSAPSTSATKQGLIRTRMRGTGDNPVKAAACNLRQTALTRHLPNHDHDFSFLLCPCIHVSWAW